MKSGVKKHKLRLYVVVMLAMLMSACVSNKPIWPAPSKSSVLKSIKASSPSAYKVIVRPSKVGVHDNATLTNSNRAAAGLLDAMALDTQFESSLIAQLKSNRVEPVVGISVQVRRQEQELNELEQEAIAETRNGNMASRKLLSVLTRKAKLESSFSNPGEARLILEYGISTDGMRVELSGRVSYPSGTPGGVRCEDKFYSSLSSGLDKVILGAVTEEPIVSTIARNFHLVRDAFLRASVRLNTVIASYLTDNSAVYSNEHPALEGAKRVFITDYIDIKGNYINDIHATHMIDDLILGYTITPAVGGSCDNQVLIITTSEESQAISEGGRRQAFKASRR